MQILPFAQHVRGDQDIEFLVRRHVRTFVVAHGAEAPSEMCRVFRRAGHADEAINPTCLELCGKIAYRVGKLAEDDHLLATMLAAHEVSECGKLSVVSGIPITTLMQHR